MSGFSPIVPQKLLSKSLAVARSAPRILDDEVWIEGDALSLLVLPDVPFFVLRCDGLSEVSGILFLDLEPSAPLGIVQAGNPIPRGSCRGCIPVRYLSGSRGCTRCTRRVRCLGMCWQRNDFSNRGFPISVSTQAQQRGKVSLPLCWRDRTAWYKLYVPPSKFCFLFAGNAVGMVVDRFGHRSLIVSVLRGVESVREKPLAHFLDPGGGRKVGQREQEKAQQVLGRQSA